MIPLAEVTPMPMTCTDPCMATWGDGMVVSLSPEQFQYVAAALGLLVFCSFAYLVFSWARRG